MNRSAGRSSAYGPCTPATRSVVSAFATASGRSAVSAGKLIHAFELLGDDAGHPSCLGAGEDDFRQGQGLDGVLHGLPVRVLGTAFDVGNSGPRHRDQGPPFNEGLDLTLPCIDTGHGRRDLLAMSEVHCGQLASTGFGNVDNAAPGNASDEGSKGFAIDLVPRGR